MAKTGGKGSPGGRESNWQGSDAAKFNAQYKSTEGGWLTDS
jgi:hypothetical protein